MEENMQGRESRYILSKIIHPVKFILRGFEWFAMSQNQMNMQKKQQNHFWTKICDKNLDQLTIYIFVFQKV